MMLRKCFGFCMALLLLLGIPTICAASHITEDDCAIGGVKAGWHSQHHYLPDAFNDTALKDVEWQQISKNIRLDQYPKVSYGTFYCMRQSKDQSLTLLSVYCRQSNQSNNLYRALFKKDWIYIYTIRADFNPDIDTSYKVLATDMKTPRGIKIGDSLEDVYQAYGREDEVTEENDGNTYYWYITPKTWQRMQSNKNYIGAKIGFLIYDNTVMGIVAVNSYGATTR